MLTLHAEIRKEKGKSFSRQLRIHNRVPGVLYGIDQDTILLTLDHNSIFNLQKKIEFYKNTLSLLIKNEQFQVKVQSIQRHSFKLKLLHIDFLYA